MVPHSPHSLDPIIYSDLERVPVKLHGPDMTESDYCLHGWNTDHDYLIPE